MSATPPERRPRTRAGWPALLLGAVLVLIGCTPSAPPQHSTDGTSTGADPATPSATSTPSGAATANGSDEDADPLQIAVVGDSITVGSQSPTFAPGQVSEDSWVSYAVGDPIQLAGGWARWGATTGEMAAAVAPVDADVLVILAGTNDLAAGTPTEQVAANLEQIVAQVGVERVLLCAVPPLDARPELVPPFNEFLRGLADDHGWSWVDPSAGIRTEGHFAPGMSVDGVHPTQAGATQIGTQVREALLTAWAGPG